MYNSIQHYDTQHNDTQLWLYCANLLYNFSTVMLSVVMSNIVEVHFGECHISKYHYH
jgi:hypothetical protein